MNVIIRVEAITGTCPVYEVGDRIVLDEGVRMNLARTTAVCMHSLASILPYYVAIAKGVDPAQLGLSKEGQPDGKAYVQCPDPCKQTGGGTVVFSLQAVS